MPMAIQRMNEFLFLEILKQEMLERIPAWGVRGRGSRDRNLLISCPRTSTHNKFML